ncbi:MAG: hypothetical protein EX268_19310 [Deltaproteobacteria bacterium]|nr:MAG: hypothetical protein EX268_19310 [Deltaproteobacteria bacterium]
MPRLGCAPATLFTHRDSCILPSRGSPHETAKEVPVEICAHEGCNCDVSETYVEQDGKRYCSEECAKGQSCGHGGCSCGGDAE